MPVVFREGGLRYYFLLERRGGTRAKIWLEPELSIDDSYGFNPREQSNILRVVAANRDLILRTWHEHFGNSRPF
jgi:hypothetical protein